MLTRISNHNFLIIAVVTAMLLVPLFPLPFPVSMTGHPWKMELVASLVLTLAATLFFVRNYFPASTKEINSIVLFFAMFTGWGWASIIWAESDRSVFHHTFVWLCYLIVFVVVSNLLRQKGGPAKLTGFLATFSAILALLMILGYFQVLTNPEYEMKFRVTYSKYSEILVITAPFLFVLSATLKSRLSILYAGSAVLSIFAIYFSLSRTSLIAVVVGLITATALLLLFDRRKQTLVKAFGLLVLFSLIFGGTQMISAGGANETTLTGRFTSKSTYQTSSGDIRFLLLGISGEMIRENPMIGLGADNFGLQINKYRERYSANNPDKKILRAGQELMLERAHNEYAQIISELGIVGFALFAGMILSGFAMLFYRLRNAHSAVEIGLRVAAASGSVAFLVSSLASSFSFRALQNGVLFFSVFAIACAPFGRQKSKTKSRIAILLIPFGLISSLFFALQASSGFVNAAGERTEDSRDAHRAFETARSLDSTNAGADMSTAIRYFNDKNPAKAAPYFESAIRKGGGVIGSYYYLAESHRLAGDLDASTKAAAECAAVFSRSPFAHVMYADLLAKQGDHSGSNAQRESARKIDSKIAETWISIFERTALETSVMARTDKNLVRLSELAPNSVVQAVIGKEKIYR